MAVWALPPTVGLRGSASLLSLWSLGIFLPLGKQGALPHCLDRGLPELYPFLVGPRAPSPGSAHWLLYSCAIQGGPRAPSPRLSPAATRAPLSCGEPRTPQFRSTWHPGVHITLPKGPGSPITHFGQRDVKPAFCQVGLRPYTWLCLVVTESLCPNRRACSSTPALPGSHWHPWPLPGGHLASPPGSAWWPPEPIP